MSNLVSQIKKLKKTQTKKTIDKRIKEFELFKSDNEVFSELCFCLMTANWQAQKAIQLQKELEKDFFNSTEKKLAKKLKMGGHRFWPQRAFNIVEARKHKEKIQNLIKTVNSKETRKWMAENVRGLGMKESSHFLRNIGYKDLAIIDFHIIDLLEREGIIKRPKTITPKKYLEIEQILAKLGKKVNLNLAELDLYLWYLETGKILK